MYYYTFIIVASFIMVLPLRGEVEVNPNYVGEIGVSTTSQMTIFQGTIADLGIDLLQVGTNLQIDFSRGFTTSDIAALRRNIFSEILSPSGTPYEYVYPDADKVVYSRVEMESEQWMYYSSESSIENLLGICTVGTCENGMPDLIKAQDGDVSLWRNPLVLGSEWNFSFEKNKITFFPDMDIFFESNYTSIIDAEGVITTPAGSFRAIRLSKSGSEIFRYDNEELDNTMGEGRSEIIEQFWFSTEGYTVIQLREEIASFANLPGPPMSQTVVIVLTSITNTETAIEQSTWGNLKKDIHLEKIHRD